MTAAHLLAAIFKNVFGANAGGPIKLGAPRDTSARTTIPISGYDATTNFSSTYAKEKGYTFGVSKNFVPTQKLDPKIVSGGNGANAPTLSNTKQLGRKIIMR